jgi:hypothetical protein
VKNRKLLVVTSILVGTATLGLFSAPAHAADGPDDAAWKVASSPTQPAPGHGTYTFPTQKKSSGPVTNVTVTGDATLTDSVAKTIKPGSKSANIQTGYTTTFDSTSTGGTFKNGTSYAKWLGTSPVNASSLTLEDAWSVAGIVTSVSLPAGISFSGSGNERTWSTTVSNNWTTSHDFSNIGFKGALVSATEDVSMSVKFGTQFFSTSTRR